MNTNDTLKAWIKHPEIRRLMEAYKIMAALGHRPEAPTNMTTEQINNQQLLEEEALRYAIKFYSEENTCNYRIGTTNWKTNRAFTLGLDVLRCLSAGIFDDLAVRLIEQQLAEIKGANK
jgi:hypothetical protein